MRLVLWANGNRGVRCLETLVRVETRPGRADSAPHTQGYGKRRNWCRFVTQASRRSQRQSGFGAAMVSE